jgi:hypothetical protein
MPSGPKDAGMDVNCWTETCPVAYMRKLETKRPAVEQSHVMLWRSGSRR